MDTIILDGSHLTIDEVIAVAYGEPSKPHIVLSDESKKNVNRSADAVQQLLNEGVIAYGITTGFGAFKFSLIWR